MVSSSVAMFPIRNPKTDAPMSCVTMEYNRSPSSSATTSPYPTAVIVATAQYRLVAYLVARLVPSTRYDVIHFRSGADPVPTKYQKQPRKCARKRM